MITFPRNQHADLARRFLDKSRREFDDGDELAGAEMFWGAAAHALIAAALERGWHFNSHGALRAVAGNLSALHQRPQWFSDFDTAENFHIHFYHGRLTDQEIAADRPKVSRFINRLLSLLVVK